MDRNNTKTTINKLPEVMNQKVRKHSSTYLKAKDEFHKHIGFDTISTSQLSRKQHDLTPKIFEKILHKFLMEIQIRMKQTSFVQNIGRLHVIDSTTMSMS